MTKNTGHIISTLWTQVIKRFIPPSALANLVLFPICEHKMDWHCCRFISDHHSTKLLKNALNKAST
jgi:hypothetical protein